jgi:hypothetical protein
MKLTRDHSDGALAVSVSCLTCGRMVRLADALVDLDGPAFEAYYHDNGRCLTGAPAVVTCNRKDCRLNDVVHSPEDELL